MLFATQDGTDGERSLFVQLVGYGEHGARVTLPIQLHGFLVECLHGHITETRIATTRVYEAFRNSVYEVGELGNTRLQWTGDLALLLAGLFPERAIHFRVSQGYFSEMGQVAYACLAERLAARGNIPRSVNYKEISQEFPTLVKVLRAARAAPISSLDSWKLFGEGGEH